MKTSSRELVEYLNTHNQAMCAELVQIVPVDGSGPYLWTTGDTDLLGYSSRGPVIAYRSGTLRHAAGSETSNLELELSVGDDYYLPNGKRFQAAVLDGDFDHAEVIIDRLYMGDWGDVSLGVMKWFEGVVGPSQPSSTGVVLTVESILSRLNKPIPRRVFQASCPYAIFDARCRLPRTTTSGVVVGAAVTADYITIDSGAAATDWTLGTVRFASGLLNGLHRQVSSQDGAELRFSPPLPSIPAVGDTVSLAVGCDKTRARCAALGNEINFGGTPYVPRPESIR